MSDFPLWRCRACGHASFPARRRCPSCGAGDLVRESIAAVGVVEVATIVRKAAGVVPGQERHLCTVRLDPGPRVLARSGEALPVGQRVRLQCRDNGAVWACADSARDAS